MTTLHKAAQAALEALEHCREAIVERGLNGSEEFAAKWGLTLPLESSAKAINDLRTALAQEPAQQVVDSDEKAGAYMEARLWEFIDMAAAWPKASPDPRTWNHVMVYAPKPAQPKGLFIDLIDSLGPEFAAELKAMDVPAVQEPVLYRFRDSECCIKAMSGYLPPKDWTPLYAHQAPQPKRLTNEQIDLMAHNEDPGDWNDLNYRDCWLDGFVTGAKAVLGEKP